MRQSVTEGYRRSGRDYGLPILGGEGMIIDTIDKKELILKIILLRENIEECAEEVDGPHWRAYKSSYYRGYLDAVSDILNKINE